MVMLIGITSLAIGAIVLVAIISAQNIGTTARSNSSEALRIQAETTLNELNLRSARENDLILRSVKNDAINVAQYTSNIFNNSSLITSSNYFNVKERMSFGVEGQYFNKENDLSSVFVPNTAKIDSIIIQQIEISAYLDFIFKPVFDNNPYIEAIYFATPNDLVRYYPNVNLGVILPPNFKATERVWFIASTIDNNPSKSPLWTEVYVDATGLGYITTAAVPVYDEQQRFIGVIGLDVTLTEMIKNIEKTQIFQDGYSFLIDQTGRAIALPDRGYTDILGRTPRENEFGTKIYKTETNFAPILLEMMEGKSGIKTINLENQEILIAYAPLESTGWSLGSVIEAGKVLEAVDRLDQQVEENTRSLIFTGVLPISGFIFLLVIIIGLFLTAIITKPIKKLVIAAEKFGMGEWEVDLPTQRTDEIGVLALAFSTMSTQLKGLVNELEQRVANRTKELQRRAAQLQTTVEVGHAVAEQRDTDNLLSFITELISSRFGYYHVGIFLLDTANEFAVLKAANSLGGKIMLSRQHKLAVGKQGIVGFVSATGEPRIALDVDTDAEFFNNPDLPETRSEMALPLIASGKVLGALDIQSTLESAFDVDDIPILGALSDLIAVAIENAQLFSENKSALEASRRAYRQLTQRAWNDLIKDRDINGYVCNAQGRISPIKENLPPGVIQTIKSSPFNWVDEQTLSIPITIRGIAQGVIRLRKNREKGLWNKEEINVVEILNKRLAIALENARLFQEVQLSAERERLVRKITTSIQSRTDIKDILHTAVSELKHTLQIDNDKNSTGNSK